MKFYLLILMLLVSAVFSACRSDNSVQPAKPVVNITSPAINSTLPLGEETLVTFSAADVVGIGRVELLINGQVVMTEAPNPSVNSYAASYRWTPDNVGSQSIELRAFNVNNVASDLAQTSVIVPDEETSDPAADTSAEENSTTATPEEAKPTATLVVFNTTTPTSTAADSTTPTATAALPGLVAKVRLNVRLGPSTDYPVVGVLKVNDSALVTGQDKSSNWWQIEYQSEDSNRGWVSNNSEYITTENVELVSVVEPPALTEVTKPTSTPMPDPSTPTPDLAALAPTIHSFTTSRDLIVAGEDVELSWDLSNADVAFLRFNGQEEGVISPGTKVVSPHQETVYTLVAKNDNGETTAEVTVRVGSLNATPTPAPVLRDGKTRIADGQYIDFDQGLVSSTAQIGSDFVWSGNNQQFYPHGSGSGTLLSRPYGDIRLDECKTASYDKPIDGVDGSTQVTGCYITNEGRYGKFLVSECDLAANLTIEWQTWK